MKNSPEKSLKDSKESLKSSRTKTKIPLKVKNPEQRTPLESIKSDSSGESSKAAIDKLREDFSGKSEKESKSEKPEKRKYKKRVSVKKVFSKESIHALLKMPFDMAGGFTGFHYNPIRPEIKDPLLDSADTVMQEFGLDVFAKWISLAIFLALYAGCSMDWQRNFMIYKREVLKKKKEQKLQNDDRVNPKTESRTAN